LQGELASERQIRRLIRHGEDQEMGVKPGTGQRRRRMAALLYRRALSSLGARLAARLAMRVTLASFLVSHLTPFGSRPAPC
jgi:hypothetical protein